MSSTVNPAIVLELIESFRQSKTMFAGCELGVFDKLAVSPATVAQLATEIGADIANLEKLLDALVGLGLLTKESGVYNNTLEATTYLTRNSPQTMTGYIVYSNDVLWKLWANLEGAVKEGSNRWKQTFEMDGPLFSSFYNTDEKLRTFIAGMHGFGLLSSPSVVAAFDLSRFSRMVDLGGATGHLPMAAAERYPNLEVAVLDLPKVVEAGRKYCEGTKVGFIAGDFFADELPPADLYALGRILHDWNDQKVGVLLKKIVAALPVGGGLLIAEKLLNEEKTKPVSGTMQSLNMMVCTEGRERSLGEYEELCLSAGFCKVDGRRTGNPVDAVLAVK